MISHYDWPGGREAMLRFGPDAGPVVIAALPLFEEANRTRAFVVTILRALAARGIASALPDLPGTGESLVPTQAISLADWRAAFAAAAASLGRAAHGVAIRGGALVDGEAPLASRWRLSPVAGDAQARELLRATDADASGVLVEIAGNLVPSVLLEALRDSRTAATGVLRTIRFESDPAPADRKLAGSPLWRRTEPDNDPALAEALADDIAAWVRACGG